MNLRDYVRVVRKRWLLLVGCLVLCLAGGVLLTVTTTKKYESTAQLFVSSSNSEDTTNSQLAQGSTYTLARVQSYTAVADSPAVAQSVIAALQKTNPSVLGQSPNANQLASEVSADAPTGKVLINLHVTDRNPVKAQVLAQALAEQFAGYITTKLEPPASPTSKSPVTVTVIRNASTPTSPVAPNKKLNIGLAFIIGVVLGVGLAIVRELLDNTVKSPEDLTSAAGLPVLGIVPWDKRTGEQAVSFRADPHGSRAEAFRQLRTNLQFIDVDQPPRIIAVTSALPGEGKTHTALNLASALAEAGQRVCLIETDLRKPTLASILGLVKEVGLTTTLIGEAEVEDVLQNAGHNFAVMTSGTVPPNPSELLVSDQCRRTIQYVADRVDIVVLDTAPLLPVADGSDVAALADATVLTVRAGKTTYEQIKRANESLANVGVKPVGAVLSMSRARSGGYNYYYYSDYRPARPGHNAKDAPVQIEEAPAQLEGQPVLDDEAADVPSVRT